MNSFWAHRFHESARSTCGSILMIDLVIGILLTFDGMLMLALAFKLTLAASSAPGIFGLGTVVLQNGNIERLDGSEGDGGTVEGDAGSVEGDCDNAAGDDCKVAMARASLSSGEPVIGNSGGTKVNGL